VIAVVLPVVYEGMNKPRELGVLFMAFSGAGIVGALAYSAVGKRLPRRVIFVAGLFAAAAFTAVFALSPPYWVQIIAMAVGGLLTGPVNPIVNVVFQERTAEELRGRALSMVFAFAYALYPVGYVVAGFLIKAYGAAWTFGAIAVALAVVAAWSVITPALRGVDSAP
jgi:MFS family permease